MFPKINLFSKKDKPAEKEVTLSIFQKAHKDWKILLLSAIAIGAIVVAIDAYLLYRVNSGNIFAAKTTEETDTSITDKRILANVVKFFEDRKAMYERFKNTPRTEIDPSL